MHRSEQFKSEQNAASSDELTSSRVRKHAFHHVEERHDPPGRIKAAICRFVDAAERPQERCLACPMVANQANPRAFFGLERNSINRPHHDRATGSRGDSAPDQRAAVRHMRDRLDQ